MAEENKDRSLLTRRPPKMSQPATFRQLGILVLDGSGSMQEPTAQRITKAEAVSSAVNDLFSRFKQSRMKNNFAFAVVNYDHRAKVMMQPTETKDLDDHGDYDPTQGLGGGTHIVEGLKAAKKLANDFLSQGQEGGLAHSVVIIIMTDGVDETEKDSAKVANELKQIPNVKICGCFLETLGAPADAMQECADFLVTLCTDAQSFTNVSSADDLRKFFVASMSNLAPML